MAPAETTARLRGGTPRGVVILAALSLAACGDAIGTPLRLVSDAGSAARAADATAIVDAESSPFHFDAFVSTDEVPSTAHCAEASSWPLESIFAEFELLADINALLRSQSVSCSGEPPTTRSLVSSRELKCSARLHARDMATRHFTSTINPDGVGPAARMTAAGYTPIVSAEAIAVAPDANTVVEQLLTPGTQDCNNLVDPRFVSVGIGRFEDAWAIDLGSP